MSNPNPIDASLWCPPQTSAPTAKGLWLAAVKGDSEALASGLAATPPWHQLAVTAAHANGMSLLMGAAKSSAACVEVVAAACAGMGDFSLDATDDLGNTALHHAVLANNAASVRSLVRLGANTHIKGNAERTPVGLAECLGFGELAQAMMGEPTKPCRLVAIDLDGTTVAENLEAAAGRWEGQEVLPAGTVEAALAFQEAGGHLIIATGRGYEGSAGVAAQLHCDKFVGLMVCGNGASVRDLKAADPAKSLAVRPLLSAETLSTLYRLVLKCNPGQQVGLKIPGPNTYMYNAPKEQGLLRFLKECVDEKTYKMCASFTYNHISGGEAEYCEWLDDFMTQDMMAPDTIFTWCDGQNTSQLAAALQPAFDEFEQLTGQRCWIAPLGMMSTATTNGGYLTIQDGGDDITSKATGLKIVCQKLGLPMDGHDILAIGNDTNDIEMYDSLCHCRCRCGRYMFLTPVVSLLWR